MQPNQMSTPVPGFAPTQLFPQSPGGGAGYSMMQAPLTYAQEVQFSGKHNGICLYLARILRYVAYKHLQKTLTKVLVHGKKIKGINLTFPWMKTDMKSKFIMSSIEYLE